MEHFEVVYEGKTVPIEVIKKGTMNLFICKFADKQALVVTTGTGLERGEFWTSIPEGRQLEAERIGALLDVHLKTKNGKKCVTTTAIASRMQSLFD